MYIAQNHGQVAQMMSYIVQNFIVLYDLYPFTHLSCFFWSH